MVKDIVDSKDHLLNIFRELLQQNESMRVIKKNLAMNCLDEQHESERQYHVLTNIIGNNSDAHAGAAAAIAITHRETYSPYMYAGSERDPETKMFETENQPVVPNFPIFRVLGMVRWQNADFNKQKHDENKKPAFRPSRQQQHEATALRLSEATPNDESGLYTSEGMYKDLDDGEYEKTIYVKTWKGRTITAVFSPEKVTRIVKREIEAKTGIPTGIQQLVAGGKVLADNASVKDYGLSKVEQSR